MRDLRKSLEERIEAVEDVVWDVVATSAMRELLVHLGDSICPVDIQQVILRLNDTLPEGWRYKLGKSTT